MIEFILLAVLTVNDIQFEVSSEYTSFDSCMEAKFALRELVAVDVVASVCIEKGQI